MKTQTADPAFYIIGPLVGEDPTFYCIGEGWILEFENATPFTGEVLTLPLPEGAIGVMPFSNENEPLAQYNTLPLSGSQNVLVKVF
jgi:hypothetical protein